jgi:CPA2 family monovalent cation:H+ antiporter-2
MIVLTPLLAGGFAPAATLAFRFGGGLLVLAVAVLAARFAAAHPGRPRAHAGPRDLHPRLAVLVLSMVLLTSTLGFSAALGAFLAGILLAESEYSHQVFADVVPFRDFFSSIFFISIGMLLQVPPVGSAWMRIAGLAAIILVAKALIVVITVRAAFRYPVRSALLTAIALSQIGEFSFVLLTVPGAQSLLGAGAFQAFAARRSSP